MGLFGMFTNKDTDENIKNYLSKGAVVLDVRTHEEWNDAHLEGAKHVVLNTIPEHVQELKSLNKPFIAVCKSGGRSQQATQYLSSQGLDVINGGPWQNVAKFVN